MARKFSISLTVALVLVAMLWGNCLSCPQMLAPHSCCHKSQPASASCHTQGLQHFVRAVAPAPVAPAEVALAALPPAALPMERLSAVLVNLHVPPGDSNPPLALRL